MNNSLLLYKKKILDIITAALRLENLSTIKGVTEKILNKENQNVTHQEKMIINNTKEAYKTLEDLLDLPIDLHLICHYHKILGTNLIRTNGKLRTFPVSVSGTSYIPEMPVDYIVKEKINEIIGKNELPYNIIKLMIYLMRAQIFEDCNKRTAVVIANHLLIKNDIGILLLPEDVEEMRKFKDKLMVFYETENYDETINFILENYIISSKDQTTDDTSSFNNLKF